MPTYMSVCLRKFDIKYTTYIHKNHYFICFIPRPQISLTELQNLNHYEASQPSRRTTITSQRVCRDAVLYVRLYMPF